MRITETFKLFCVKDMQFAILQLLALRYTPFVTDFSPPSMVSRLPYKGGPLPKMYPMIMGGDLPDSQQLPIIKQEKNDRAAFQNALLKELKQSPTQSEMSPIIEETTKKMSVVKAEQNEIKNLTEQNNAFENDVKKDKSQVDETVFASAAIPKSQTTKKMEVDEPLDLSLPRPGKLFTVKSLVPGKLTVFFNICPCLI